MILFYFLIALILFFFFFFDFVLCNNQSNFTVLTYNYDRHFYLYNFNYINHAWYEGYFFDFSKYYADQVFNIRHFRFFLDSFFYKYYRFSLNFDHYDYFYYKRLRDINSSDKELSYLYEYAYSFDVIKLNFKKSNSLAFLTVTPFFSFYGSLFFYDLLFDNYSYFYYFCLFFYFIFLFIFFVFIFLFIFFRLLVYLFFYKKLFLLGYFLTPYTYNADENTGGHLDSMEEQELDLSLGDTYYNIIKYEFNYFNYILYLNKYLFSWILFIDNVSTFLNLGQVKYSKFYFFSNLYIKIEANFFAFMTVDDDFGEWAYYPYEHMVEAFPESNFYLYDAVFEYATVDLAFDFMLRRRLLYEEYIHPLSISRDIIEEDDMEYEEEFDDIKDFFKNHKFSDSLLNTYRLRFFLIYKNLKIVFNNMENGIFFVGASNSFLEVYNRMDFSNFDNLYDDRPFFREISNAYDISNRKESDFDSIEDEFDFERIEKKEEFEKSLSEEVEDYLVVLPKTVYDPFIFENSKNLFSYNTSYSSYIKLKFQIYKNFSFDNFFSLILETSFSHWFLRSKWLWSKYDIELDYESIMEDVYVFSDDGYTKDFFNIYTKKFNFSELTFSNSKNLSFISSFNSFFKLEDISDLIKYPSFNNYIGYLLINPFLRSFKDLFLFNLHLNKNLDNLIISNNRQVVAFNFLSENTYIVDNFDLPSGMVLSTDNVFDESLYSNSNLNDVLPIEVIEQEQTDNSWSKDFFYDYLSFTFFTLFLPSFLITFYSFLIINSKF
jgi:hypothetical protein